YRAFATPRELERLLADDLAVLLSETFEGELGGAEPPAGTVTFLLTDIEGSTRLWEAVPEAMEVALERHNRLGTGVTDHHDGVVVLTQTTRGLVAGRLGGGFGLRRLGEFRLRDLAEPELIYQLIHADLPADFPPIRTVAGRGPRPLPVDTTSLVGREQAIG